VQHLVRAGVPYLATPDAIGGALSRDAFPAAALEMYDAYIARVMSR
jgi:hypothetical protein